MGKKPHMDLSRRERQIMLIIYEAGSASAQDVMDRLPDPPSYSAVRAMLRLLEEKGQLYHELDGQRYIFRPTTPHSKAQESALKQMVRTFFNGSAEQAVAALLDLEKSEFSDEALSEIERRIELARKEGR
jgi:predicted transcriptional regulator